jgi:hypothetical protein
MKSPDWHVDMLKFALDHADVERWECQVSGDDDLDPALYSKVCRITFLGTNLLPKGKGQCRERLMLDFGVTVGSELDRCVAYYTFWIFCALEHSLLRLIPWEYITLLAPL